MLQHCPHISQLCSNTVRGTSETAACLGACHAQQGRARQPGRLSYRHLLGCQEGQEAQLSLGNCLLFVSSISIYRSPSWKPRKKLQCPTRAGIILRLSSGIAGTTSVGWNSFSGLYRTTNIQHQMFVFHL